MLHERNYWAIIDFANGQRRADMQGTRLHALYRLIQMKGEPIRSNDQRLNGVKVYPISDVEHIGIIRTGPANCFFPCKLQTFILTKL